jgi:3',5'-cyclic AMP phosphodiesterase CpdA
VDNVHKESLGARRFRFAILADTHINPRDGESPSPWLTNQQANARARAMVHEINHLQPSFTIHLGDMVHPVPSQATYSEAAQRAREVFGLLESPVHYVAGNHDMGDKFVDWMPAAVVNDSFLDIYEKHFGKDFYAFEKEGCRFIIINAQVLNSGLSREKEQWTWLEEELGANTNKRIFLFSHYPPYIADPQESEHYDNIGEPARSRLLSLVEQRKVTAIFAAHVHNFFYDRLGTCDFYVLPAVSAVRHDYSEIFRVSPADSEHGRADNAKLGFFIVDVYEHGHVAHFVRSYGKTAHEADEISSNVLRLPQVHSRLCALSPVGVDMRHAWAKAIEIPYQGAVDEFYRKRARNDYVLASLWEMGLRKLRVPIDDLLDIEARKRIADLRELGHEILLFTYEVPKGEVARTIEQYQGMFSALEVIVPWRRIEGVISDLVELKERTKLPVYLSKLRSSAEAKASGARYTHFISHGFNVGEEDFLAEMQAQPLAGQVVDGVVFRVSPVDSICRRTADAADWAKANNKRVILHVSFADENPAQMANDEISTANRVAASLMSGYANAAECSLFFDTLADMDRGYFPRTGLVDRRYNPRLAGKVLGTLQGELANVRDLKPISEHEIKGGSVLISESDKYRFYLLLPAERIHLADIDFKEASPGETRVIVLDTGSKVKGQWHETEQGLRLSVELNAPLQKPHLVVIQHKATIGSNDLHPGLGLRQAASSDAPSRSEI